MDAMIDQGRDNIAPNWKENLVELELEKEEIMNQINDKLEEEKSLKTIILDK